MALEQQTILAIVRVVASFSENLSPSQPPPPSSSPPSTSTSLPPPANPKGDAVRSGSTAGLSPSAAFPPPPAAAAGSGSGGSGDVSMPMLPRGVSVSLVVDLAAVSVALAEDGVNVAAVALSAAHCKVNVSSKNMK